MKKAHSSATWHLKDELIRKLPMKDYSYEMTEIAVTNHFRAESLVANLLIRDSSTYTGYDAKTVPESTQWKVIFIRIPSYLPIPLLLTLI